MNEKALRTMVKNALLTQMAVKGDFQVPVSSSNRHIHLSQRELAQLFGRGYQLKKLRDLVQPGQYACEECVTLETCKGKLKLRVVGPVRRETQIEISCTDAIKYGIKPVVRMSGDTAGTPGGVLRNGTRVVNIMKGIMVAARHLHMSDAQAAAYGMKDGDVVSLHVEGERAAVFGNIVVRTGDGHELEAHIDTDEANAAGLHDGAICRIEKQEATAPKAAEDKAGDAESTTDDAPERALITEEDIKAARQKGQAVVTYSKTSIITPLARDTALEYNIELRCVQRGKETE